MALACAAMDALNAPIKLGDRQEQFCQQILGSKSASEAYRIAYGASQKASESNGPRLMGSDRVKARIAQLRDHMAAAERITVPFLTRGLLDAASLARETKQASAMAQALMGVAKLHGLIIDRAQVEAIVRKPSATTDSPDEMTEDAWLGRHGLTIDHLSDKSDEPDCS